jgi:hypothetical protein
VPAAAVAVALIVVAAFALTSHGGGRGAAARAGGSPGAGGGAAGGAPQGQPVARWQALSAQNNALGTWSYGHSLVVAADTRVTAYDRATGRQLWQTKAPVAEGHATVFCGASQGISGSTVVLGIGLATKVGSDCHSVTVLNVATGKLGWLRGLPSSAEALTYAKSLDGHLDLAQKGLIVEISGQTVVASWLGVLAGFSVASGTEEWTRVIGGAPVLQNFSNYVVKDLAVAGADTYVVAWEVFPQSMKLLRIGTATGKVVKEVTLSKRGTGLAEPSEGTILSVAPLTIVVEEIVPADVVNVISFGPNLAVTRVFRTGSYRVRGGATAGQPLYNSAMPGNVEAHQFYPFTLGRGLLIALTLPPDGGGQGNSMVAFNGVTGTAKWATAVPGTDILYPVAVTGSTVEVAGATQAGSGNPVLISVDAATGKVLSISGPRVLGPAPMGQANGIYRFVPAGGHVYGVDWSLAKTARGSVPAVFSLG